MWPQCRNSNIEDYEMKLREMEIETYSKIISVFRAKGNLSNDRRKLLKQISSFLNIPPERHRAEARKVSNDDLLAEMSIRLTGKDWTIDWCQEGKRNIPTPLRFPNETVCTPLADYIASLAAIGPRCIESVNSNTECSATPLKQAIDSTVPIDSEIKNNWTQLLSSVSETRKRTNSVKSVSVQTIRRKVSPQGCTYCKRRKEMKKKKSLKEVNLIDKVSDTEVIEESSKETINVTNKQIEVSELSSNSLIILPSGKKILIENSCEESYEDITDSISATIIAQEIEVETEPFDVTECNDISENEEVPKFDISIPSTSRHTDTYVNLENIYTDRSSVSDGANEQNNCLLIPNESDSIQQSRIPRILSCGQRRRGGLKRPQNSMEISPSLDVIQIEKKQKIEIEEDGLNFISVSEVNPSTSHSESQIITSSDSDSGQDDMSSSCSDDDDDEEEELQTSDECTVTSNVTVGSKIDNSPSDIIYQIKNEANSPLEESIPPLSIEMAEVNPSSQTISCTVSQGDLSPSTFISSTEEVKTCLSKSTDDPPPLKIIKIYNGEKKVHGTIHLRSGNMKDFLSRLPNARVTQVLMKKNIEESQITSITNSFQETHVLLKGNVTDDSNQIQKSSSPLVNGHEESYLAAEISVQADPYACTLESESVEECSSKCISHQGNSDRKEAFINLQSVLSSSKEDSKETDQFINGT